ncbi:WLM domain-containing protein, partial [Crepidotus variabilis]
MSSEPSASTSATRSLEETISLTISFRGASHPLTVAPTAPLLELHTLIEDLTDVPPPLQKVLYKGKKLVWESEETAQSRSVLEAGLKKGMKVQVLGSTLKEVEGMRKEEGEMMRRQRIMRERALKAPVKLRPTGGSVNTPTSISSASLQYRFYDIQPLPHLPSPASALVLLQKLSNDPAIQHVMKTHEFKVGLLTELAPHEHPELLGLNENRGQTIKLRLRTNDYDGFRNYKDVRRVLCHELTHNTWGDHDENFKRLNSQLNREVAEYEKSVANGTHSLSGVSSKDMYQPSSELEAEARTYVLGSASAVGSSTISSDLDGELPEERRRKLLDATMNRLRKEEEEIEHSCGTG